VTDSVPPLGGRPRLLDLFCGAGGAAMGYYRAGFDVVGIDHVAQPHYPFEFIQADALTFMETCHSEYLDTFDAIHASPPCQDHMKTPHRKHGTGWLLDASRQLLKQTGLPWVIENVDGADMVADYCICGCQVGCPKIRRVRFFEVSWGPRAGLFELDCHDHSETPLSVVGHGTPTWVREKWKATFGRDPNIADYREAMGIDWMNRNELSQAIPPAYTEFIGEQLMAHLKAKARD
jgi:DNA (cytosine-5)-methyltransferase 1